MSTIQEATARPFMTISLSQHAINQFRKRSGVKSDARAARLLAGYAATGRLVGPERWLSHGWLLIIRNNEVRTAYRPDKRQMKLLKV